jgi:hypothetical protein
VQLSSQVATSSPGTITPTVITGQTTLGTGLNLTSGTQTTSSGATLTLGRAPTAFPGTNPSVFGTGRFTFEGLYPIPGAGDATFLAALRTNSLSGLLPVTAVYFDQALGSVAAVGAAWNVFDRGTASQCLLGAPCLAPGSATAADTLSIAVLSGGAPGTSGVGFNAFGDRLLTGLTENFAATSSSPISFGRYSGGQVDVFNSDGTLQQLTTLDGHLALRASVRHGAG